MVGVQKVEQTVKQNESKEIKSISANHKQKLTASALQQFKLNT